MTRTLIGLCAAIMLAIPFAHQPLDAGRCATIQDGTITDVKGDFITVGYDQWGYNYQAHMYNGLFGNYNKQVLVDEDTCPDDEACSNLEMKWNDAWLSNMDCDLDDTLDRPSTYIGSGAWLTNHQSGEYLYTDAKGREKTAHWTYFVKIVAVPADATSTGGIWYEADGTEIGPTIWGAFAIVQEVWNDPVGGFNGIQYLSPAHPGFGVYR